MFELLSRSTVYFQTNHNSQSVFELFVKRIENQNVGHVFERVECDCEGDQIAQNNFV